MATSERKHSAITVALPVGPGFSAEGLRAALSCVRAQTLAPSEILVIANGLSEAEAATLVDVMKLHDRGGPESESRTASSVRTLVLDRANLAAALNLALREARTPLVARMDADDSCPSERFEVQAAALELDPALAAIGCAWEVAGVEGVRAVMRPSTDPRRLRWTLRLGNSLAHGSMVLQRDTVLAAGGYDESLARAQDYDLWLRLTRDAAAVGAVEQVLYRYAERGERGVAASSRDQARAAARAMVRSWGGAGDDDSTDDAGVVGVLTDAMLAENGGGAVERLERVLDERPSQVALTAWLWMRDRFPSLPRRGVDLCRRARLREVGAAMRAEGARRAWLWGAGAHTAWLLERAADLGVEIAGIVDDGVAGEERFGRRIAPPRSLVAREHVLLSSDFHEDAMWERSATLRDRGVRVWRLYA